MKRLPRALLSAATAVSVALGACGSPVAPSPTPGAASLDPGGNSAPASLPAALPSAPAAPPPGHELYGFVPYWEMDGSIASHLAQTPLTTVGLFSVTNTAKGAIDASGQGYRQITGAVGSALIRAAHHRGTRVELVFTSFGASRNATFFSRPAVQTATIASLVTLVGTLGADGVDVDVEGMDIGLAAAYGSFVGRLRSALVAANPHATVSVATGVGPTGAAMAAAATGAGADRVFLMAYDYRTASSEPGAVSPIVRADEGRSITWSLDLYGAVGVPPQRLLLGLPLYGMAWPVAGPVVGAASLGNGASWILRRHLDVLTNAAAVPVNDPLEGVDVYLLGSDGSVTAPSPAELASAPPMTTTWSAVYVDSPATLERKLGLGETRGFAGAGFWAIGYERGLPAFTQLMTRFVAGDVPPS